MFVIYIHDNYIDLHTFFIETFDVNSATAISVDSGILVTGELIGNSHAMGCFVVVQCDERNSDRYQVLLRNGDESTVSATINVPSMDEVSHTVNVYDLEKDGLPNSMPAVEVDGIRVPPHGKDGIYLYICWKFRNLVLHMHVFDAIVLYSTLYVTRSGKSYNFLELYISRKCTRHALRNDASCSKIEYSVLKLYTEICELRKTY